MIPVFFQNEKSTFQINETQFELIHMNPNQFRQTVYNEAEMVIDPITHKVIASMVIDVTDNVNCITTLNINLEYNDILNEILQQLLDRALTKYGTLSIKTRKLDEKVENFLIKFGFKLKDEYTVCEFSYNPYICEDEE